MGRVSHPKKNQKFSTDVIMNKLPQPSDDMSLSRYGYKLDKTVLSRQSSLRRASKRHGSLPVLRRLNLIRNINKRGTKNYKKLSRDVEYMKKNHKKTKSRKRRRRTRK